MPTSLKRRDFSVALVAASSGLVALPSFAQSSLKAGQNYAAVTPPAPVDTPAGKIEVVEFFSYWCPHCFQFEPQLEAWAKKLPADVAFRRCPVNFMADFETKQRLYFTLEAMGKVDEYQMKVFDALHVQKVRMMGDKATIEWAVKQGLDQAKFTETFNSFAIAGKVKRAVQIQEAYKVEGVPALGVAGRYWTDGPKAGSMGGALKVVEDLIAMARKNA